MITAVIYDEKSGEILKQINCSRQDVGLNCAAGQAWMEYGGTVDGKEVRQGAVVDRRVSPAAQWQERWPTVRRRRDSLLKKCDWTQMPDSPLNPEIKHQWGVYRQALRDITLQPDPFNIVWPTPPG